MEDKVALKFLGTSSFLTSRIVNHHSREVIPDIFYQESCCAFSLQRWIPAHYGHSN